MEFNEKLKELRRQKELTQEELAEKLFVSRTAVSKWESGRGYPGIESIKAIANLFGITIDELLSGDELLTIAEEDNSRKEKHLCDMVFGLLDVSVILFLWLPLFGQTVNGIIEDVSLLSLTETKPYLLVGYYIIAIGIILLGIFTLVLQSCRNKFWQAGKSKLSLILSFLGTFLFIISRQPYAASFLLVFLIIKVLMLIKWK